MYEKAGTVCPHRSRQRAASTQSALTTWVAGATRGLRDSGLCQAAHAMPISFEGLQEAASDISRRSGKKNQGNSTASIT